MINYKFFTKRFGTDAVEAIDQLRQAFPNCSFARGKYKSETGIYCFNNIKNREYGDNWDLENGDVFWGVNDPVNARTTLDQYLSEYEDRIPVKLQNGIVIKIYPASAIPKKVLFSRRQVQQDDSPYAKTTEYGRMAYELYELTQKQEALSFNDPKFVRFLKIAFEESYKLPIEVVDSLELFSQADLDKVFAAAMGFDWEFLKKTFEESKQPC